jgi:type I restriction enzyme S subunit
MVVREVRFSELLAAIVDNRGKTCPTSDTGIPLIATNCVRNDLLYPTYEKARFVSRETYTTWFRDHPKPGDILFVNKATPGRVCLVPDPVDFCIAQDMVAVRADGGKVYPRFLFAALRSQIVQQRIGTMHVGTLIPHFKKGDFDKLLIPVPDRSVQTFIGDIYYALSAKIELNRQMNETLQAMARALFKSWFVDFDPVHAKVEGRGTGLPKHVDDLFPDSFENSELGEIPKGWRVFSLGDACNRVSMGPFGSDIKTDNFIDVGVPVVRGGNLKGGFIDANFVFVSDAKADQLRNANAFPGDIVITHRGTLGQVGLIPKEARFPRYVVSQSQMLLSVNPSFATSRYVFEFLRSESGQHALLANTSQTGVPAIGRPTASVRSIRMLLPSVEVLKHFGRIVDPINSRRIRAIYESSYLAALRDTLLPKLLSGELRPSSAESLVRRIS